jgi:hypothetical protein
MGGAGQIFSCAADRGHKHAHVTMDEASGGLFFWDDKKPGYWWLTADMTERDLQSFMERSRRNKAPLPHGLSFEIFKKARGVNLNLIQWPH